MDASPGTGHVTPLGDEDDAERAAIFASAEGLDIRVRRHSTRG